MHTTRILKTTFSGSSIETWQFMEKLAKENGFNPLSKFDYGQKWSKISDPGVTVYEEFLVNDNERLHLVVENDQHKRARSIKMKNLIINND